FAPAGRGRTLVEVVAEHVVGWRRLYQACKRGRPRAERRQVELPVALGGVAAREPVGPAPAERHPAAVSASTQHQAAPGLLDGSHTSPGGPAGVPGLPVAEDPRPDNRV